jgi:hypothetical protein
MSTMLRALGVPIPARQQDVEQELCEERAAIIEFDAGLSRAEAEAQAWLPLPLLRPLPWGEPIEAHESGRLQVGDMCPVCREAGRISHLYEIQDGVRRCRRCLRR